MLRRIFALTLMIAFFVSGCGPAPYSSGCSFSSQTVNVQNNTITAEDGLCRKIVLNGTPSKIVSLAPSNTEILFAVGAGSQVAGRDDFSDYPKAVESLPKVGGTDKYNNEQIVALHPDLVLAAEINTADQVKALESLGLTVYYLKNPTTLEEMYSNLQTVAKLTGHEADALTLITSLKTRVAAVDNKIATVTSRPSVFYEIDATDPAKPYTAGPSTFIDLLI